MKRVLFVVLLGALFLSACGGAAQTSGGATITVSEAWGRPSPKEAMAGAFYMKIKNSGGEADKLLGAKTDACGMVELHESYMTQEGAMGMRPVEGGVIEIPAGGEVELKVGGLHVMCMQKNDSMFTAGSKINLTLKFEKAGDIPVSVEIREQ
ncbi:MAG: copper chaperone PCu(A)C [Anaerolineales bacterium]